MSKTLKVDLNVPIFHVEVVLVCAKDIHAERMRMNKQFGKVKGAWSGLCSRGEHGNFGVFFDERNLTHSMIGHEILHLTLWILEYCGVRVTSKHDETAAYLCGYLSEWAYAQLGKRVKG